MAIFGTTEVAGAQAEAVRIRWRLEHSFPVGAHSDDALTASLLTLSGCDGHRTPRRDHREGAPGKSVAVVGDGAVGLWCHCREATWCGADYILGRHAGPHCTRQGFGATRMVKDQATPRLSELELTGGYGVHSVLECVGSNKR